jgi:RNA-directed DNA polymerase
VRDSASWLSAAARSVDARYTRYADDLAFSFGASTARRADRFHLLAAGIALDEGFQVQFRKTRFIRQGEAQLLGGLVVNSHLNVPRREFDRLKATIHRAVREGPSAVESLRAGDYQAQLLGRIEWVAQTNPSRGGRLRALARQIEW